MKKIYLLALLIFPLIGFAQEDQILKKLDSKADFYGDLAMKIWSNPELGYLETESSALLQQTLKDAGFVVKAGVAGVPTAFVAEYGSGKPVIGIMAEFDALPGVSQKAVPFRDPVVEGGAGHACGHHLFGAASTAAGISVMEWMKENNSNSYPKMIDDVIDNGEKINGTFVGGSRQKENVEVVIDYGVKETHDDVYHHKGRIDGVIKCGNKI